MQKILMHIQATVVLHNWLIELNDELEEEYDEDDNVPHPNDIFDPEVGQEVVLPDDFDTRLHLLTHLQHLNIVSLL